MNYGVSESLEIIYYKWKERFANLVLFILFSTTRIFLNIYRKYDKKVFVFGEVFINHHHMENRRKPPKKHFMRHEQRLSELLLNSSWLLNAIKTF